MRFTYHYERRDFVQACIVIMRSSVRRRLIWMCVWLALFISIIAWGADEGRALLALKLLATGQMPWDIYAAIAGPLAVFWFQAEIAGWLICAPIFKRNALANQDVLFELDEQGVHAGTDDFSTRVTWPAVKRAVETPTALVLVLSGREGLYLPRRAVPSDEVYAQVLDLVKRHVPSA